MSSHVLAKNAGADALQIAKLFNVDGWVCVVTGGKLLSPQASFILAVCTSFEPSLTFTYQFDSLNFGSQEVPDSA